MVYAAEVNGRRLSFEVLGIWRKNMVIRDRETSTIWQQATGEAIDGPLKGHWLEILFAQEMTWGAVREAYPQASYALAPAQYTGLVPQALFKRLMHFSRIPVLPGLFPFDRRLGAHEWVVGVVVNGQARAYPFALLRSEKIIQDQVGGEEIVLQFDEQDDQVIVRGKQGNPIRCDRQWWLSWSEFHPRCTIYGKTIPTSTP